jgi:hypothetical protein
MECVTGAGLDGLPVLKDMITRGEESIFPYEHAADAGYEPENEEVILPFDPAIVAGHEDPGEDDFFDGSEVLEEEEDAADDFFEEEEDAADEARIRAMITPEVMEKMLANMRAHGTII